MFVFVELDHAMHAQVDTDTDKQHRAYMPEPFFERVHLLRQVTDTYRAVTNQPCNQHDRQTGTETEDDRHQPVPRARQGQCDIDHRQEIDQSMRTESDREEDTQDERPQPTGIGIGVLEELTYAVIMLVVMMSAEQQHDTAYQHERRQDRFAPSA